MSRACRDRRWPLPGARPAAGWESSTGNAVARGEPGLAAVAGGRLAHDSFECGAEGGLRGVADGGADAAGAAAGGGQFMRGGVHPPGDQVLERREAGESAEPGGERAAGHGCRPGELGYGPVAAWL